MAQHVYIGMSHLRASTMHCMEKSTKICEQLFAAYFGDLLAEHLSNHIKMMPYNETSNFLLNEMQTNGQPMI